MQGAEKSDDATLSSMPAHFAQERGQAQEIVTPRTSRPHMPSAGRKRKSIFLCCPKNPPEHPLTSFQGT